MENFRKAREEEESNRVVRAAKRQQEHDVAEEVSASFQYGIMRHDFHFHLSYSRKQITKIAEKSSKIDEVPDIEVFFSYSYPGEAMCTDQSYFPKTRNGKSRREPPR